MPTLSSDPFCQELSKIRLKFANPKSLSGYDKKKCPWTKMLWTSGVEHAWMQPHAIKSDMSPCSASRQVRLETALCLHVGLWHWFRTFPGRIILCPGLYLGALDECLSGRGVMFRFQIQRENSWVSALDGTDLLLTRWRGWDGETLDLTRIAGIWPHLCFLLTTTTWSAWSWTAWRQTWPLATRQRLNWVGSAHQRSWKRRGENQGLLSSEQLSIVLNAGALQSWSRYKYLQYVCLKSFEHMYSFCISQTKFLLRLFAAYGRLGSEHSRQHWRCRLPISCGVVTARITFNDAFWRCFWFFNHLDVVEFFQSVRSRVRWQPFLWHIQDDSIAVQLVSRLGHAVDTQQPGAIGWLILIGRCS